ncbi:MAG: bactofilin family protein [Hyphomicrobiaceae bacterium]
MFGRKNAKPEPHQSDATYYAPRDGARSGSQAQPPTPPPSPVRDIPVVEGIEAEGSVLIGKGTMITGELSNCTRVEVQGHLEGNIIADRVTIRQTGVVRGGIIATSAEVHGIVSGEMRIDKLLDIRSTGSVAGDLTYGEISVEIGGSIFGNIREPEQVGADPRMTALANGRPTPETFSNQTYAGRDGR